jgi:5-methylcytosine-specific restriction enzyme A
MARYSFYHSQRWRKLRQYIIDRDGGMCVYCGGRGDIAHHKIWVDDSNVNDPSVVWSPDNLETVCANCHAKIHSKTGASATADGYRFDDEGNLIYMKKENKTVDGQGEL